jgi:predicted ATPase
LEQQLSAAAGAYSGLCLDDLHLFDELSLQITRYVVQRLFEGGQQRRLRLIAAFQADQLAPARQRQLERWWRNGQVCWLELGPLRPTETLALLRALTNGDGGIRFAARLQQVTAGNPLFIVESLYGLMQMGWLRQEHGRWVTPIDHNNNDYRELPLATSLTRLIVGRIERLGLPVKRLLEVLSLSTGPLWLHDLQTTTNLATTELLAAVEVAERNQLLDSHGESWRFRHDLVRQTIEQSLSGARRRLLHQQLAETLTAQMAQMAQLPTTNDLRASWQARIQHHRQQAGLASVAPAGGNFAGSRQRLLLRSA